MLRIKMSKFDIYVLIVCILVFAVLTALFSYLIYTLVKYSIKLIRLGGLDEELKIEYQKQSAKKHKKASKILDYVLSGVLCAVFLGVFGFSMYVNINSNSYSESTPTIKVVATSSMETKNEKNKYLFENDLNNQFSAYDLVLTYKVPDEFDLKLYDIVVYEIDGTYLIHRIVGIEEPNSTHPEHRYFLLQGDAIERPDRFPVMYSQIKAIYKNEHVPFLGSFILFMQSPAGYLCIMLVLFAVIVTPMLEKKLNNERFRRLEKACPEVLYVKNNGRGK